MAQSVTKNERIVSLDMLRGFALLGILLVNILSFGAISAMIFNPSLGFSLPTDIWVWALIELTAEGAMRALFSMLFGAGVLMFLGKGDGRKKLHFKRIFWLLIFGLINGYVLMWSGDILSTYALAAFILYFLRNMSPKGLAILSAFLFACLCAYSTVLNIGLEFLRNAAVHNSEAAKDWAEFYELFAPNEAAIKDEIAQRKGSFFELLSWSATAYNSLLLEIVPMFLFWDALVFMCIGMALYRYQTLQGLHLGVALGWMGLLILAMLRFGIGQRLAAVGRMALSNYLLQSVICLFIFSGIGFGLLGDLRRSELYIVVAIIWAFQLWLSSWWLARYNYGPAEWLWRALTYGKVPTFIRKSKV